MIAMSDSLYTVKRVLMDCLKIDSMFKTDAAYNSGYEAGSCRGFCEMHFQSNIIIRTTP